MKTFDYISAWHQAAKPAYESLPQNVRDLLDRTARVAADLHQLQDTSMPWPSLENDPQASDVSGVQGFREAFRKIPAEILAKASRVIFSIGHWYPASADGFAVPGRDVGAHWKFSHYADQDLRDRLGLHERGYNGRESGWQLAVHEGAIRITYSDPNLWTWAEVAPATMSGAAAARQLIARFKATGEQAFEAFRAGSDHLVAWPPDWLPLVDHRFMIEEDALAAREHSTPRALGKSRADVIASATKKIAEVERDRDAMLWLLDHGLSTENVIYYHHTDRLCFGWRTPVSDAVLSVILDKISECPFAYDIKTADGRTLSGD